MSTPSSGNWGSLPQIFYSHFPSKLQLLVESFQTFLSWNLDFVEPRLMESTDQGERLLGRLVADHRATEFGSDVFAQIRMEGGLEKGDKLRLAEQAWAGVVGWIIRDFESARALDSPPPPIPLELLAYSMLGAHHNASARASWDEQYSRADLLRTHLWLWLAVVAALERRGRHRFAYRPLRRSPQGDGRPSSRDPAPAIED